MYRNEYEFIKSIDMHQAVVKRTVCTCFYERKKTLDRYGDDKK